MRLRPSARAASKTASWTRSTASPIAFPRNERYRSCMSIVINRVYTGVGDAGTTRLAGGQEVDKTDLRIEAYGTVDELNAVIGVVAETDAIDAAFLQKLRQIQNELFDLGGELATLPEDLHPKQALIGEDAATRLEQEMDAANEHLPTLRSFVLPGGGLLSARLHVARTVCRRA